MAVYVTVVVPRLKVSPLSWVDVNVETAQLSAEVGAVHVTTALQAGVSFVCEMLAGVPEMEGSSSSVTVTEKLEVEVFPWMSVAV